MQNMFNNFIYPPQPDQPLQLALQPKPPPLHQTNMLSFIAPSHQALHHVQPGARDLQAIGQKIPYGPPTCIFLWPQPMSQDIMSCNVPPYPDHRSIQPNPKETPSTEQSIECTPQTLHQPVSKAPEFPYAVDRVDMMDVEQTGNWVRTLGKDMAWEEAESYAKKFKENCIRGYQLRMLTDKILKLDLGMAKLGHRIELLRIIQLFCPPNTTCEAERDLVPCSTSTAPTQIFNSVSEVVKNDLHRTSILNQLVQPWDSNLSQMDTTSESGYTQYNMSTCSTSGVGLVNMECTPVPDSGYEADLNEGCNLKQDVLGPSKDDLGMPGMKARKSDCVANTQNYNDPMSQTREETRSNRCTTIVRYSSRFRKLIVTLRPDQQCQDSIAIRRRFAEFNLVVDSVEKWQESDSTYLVVFPDSYKAQDAYLMAEDLGYNLKRKWPDRPKPDRPIKYISICKLRIREGKALSQKEVGVIEADEIVTVNQVKGRRARLVKVVDGRPKNIGWVSLSTDDGAPLLKRVSEVSETSSGCS